jgi:hypothetical protein
VFTERRNTKTLREREDLFSLGRSRYRSFSSLRFQQTVENQYCRQSARWVTRARKNIGQTAAVSVFSSIPAPVVPPTAAITDVIGDGIAIAIVCFVVNISMSKLFATKYKYQISPNQVLTKIEL